MKEHQFQPMKEKQLSQHRKSACKREKEKADLAGAGPRENARENASRGPDQRTK
jgi:hypothetical protein